MPLTIAFKFCGGCNPHYDRRLVYDRLSAYYKADYKTTIAKSGQTYDILVVIAGCKNACADYADIGYTKELIIITDEQLPF
jgi:4-hydroxybutyrate CoA-transferase